MDPHQRKDVIRRLALTRRAALAQDQRDRASGQISDRVLALPEIEAASSVLGYVSVRSEVGTESLLAALLAAGTAVHVPFVGPDGAMQASRVGSLAELAPGYRGIPEPRARFPVDAAGMDAIIAPGVAFDATGARLGYGGGFFDRFLAAAPGVPRIGLCFEVQVFDAIPVEEHDVGMDVVVTEERVIRPGAPG